MLRTCHVWLFAISWTVSLPGSSVHGISKARTQECVAVYFSRWSSPPTDWTHISYIGRWILHPSATREALESLHLCGYSLMSVFVQLKSPHPCKAHARNSILRQVSSAFSLHPAWGWVESLKDPCSPRITGCDLIWIHTGVRWPLVRHNWSMRQGEESRDAQENKHHVRQSQGWEWCGVSQKEARLASCSGKLDKARADAPQAFRGSRTLPMPQFQPFRLQKHET